MNKSVKQSIRNKQQPGRKPDVVTNVPLSRGVARYSSLPRLSSTYDHITVKRREFVGTLTNGSTINTFYMVPNSANVPGYDFNPGNAIMFPWLSAMAPNYERFAFRKLSFDFLPAQSANTNGRYYVGVDYDYDDTPAALKSQLMGNRTAAEAPVWQSLRVDCVPQELHRDQPTKYVSANTRTNFVEPRTAYCGFLMCAIETPTQNLTIDLWVDYEVDLITPVSDNFVLQDSYLTSYLTPLATTNVTSPWGTAFIGFPAAVKNAVGAVKAVLAGVKEIPQLYMDIFGLSQPIPNVQAYDLKEARRGTLSIYSDAYVTGSTPSTVLAIDGFRANALINDQDGKQLGFASDGALADITSGSRNVPTDLIVAGKPVRNGICMFLSRLFSVYPTARWITPFFMSANALAAGQTVHGIKYEL